ncbi:hypothetical protein AX16_007359 [Volvariella volvacea WC 439]|nr:hypothetical protein AX16_007359 [Volvariella volvacea WC 439]
MATTQVPTSQASTQPAGTATAGLCDYCHQKPRFANHDYCSKTCANQAAALCKYCHKKPKFQGFDYCGKTCSSLAGASKPGPAGQATRNNAPQAHPAPAHAHAHATGAQSRGANQRGTNPQHRSQPTTNSNNTSGINAAQIAQLVAQQLPQLLGHSQAAGGLAASSTAQGGTAAVGSTGQAQPAGSSSILNVLSQAAQAHQPVAGQGQGASGSLATVANGTSSLPPVDPQTQPSLATQPVNNVSNTSTGIGAGAGDSAQQPDGSKCLIPGCNKPVYVDATGVKVSNYCSKRHRE